MVATNEYIELVKSETYMNNVARRKQCMSEIFIAESLPLALPESDWADVKDMSPSLLEGLYPEIFLLGPYYNDFKVYHRDLLRFAMTASAADFKQWEQEMIATYADRHLNGGLPQVARRNYFDYTHAMAYGRILMMDYRMNPKTDPNNLYKKFWAAAQVKKSEPLNVALTVLTMLVLMRHVPQVKSGRGQIQAGAWEQLLAKHQAMCVKWGFTPLAGIPVEATDG